METKTYIFEGKTVEDATEKGLQELGLSAGDVAVEVKSKGGLFTKAQVIITILEKEEIVQEAEETTAIVEETVEEESIVENTVESSEKPVIDAVQEELLARAEERARTFINELVLQMGLDCEVEVTRDGTDINVKANRQGSKLLYRLSWRGTRCYPIYDLVDCKQGRR